MLKNARHAGTRPKFARRGRYFRAWGGLAPAATAGGRVFLLFSIISGLWHFLPVRFWLVHRGQWAKYVIWAARRAPSGCSVKAQWFGAPRRAHKRLQSEASSTGAGPPEDAWKDCAAAAAAAATRSDRFVGTAAVEGGPRTVAHWSMGSGQCINQIGDLHAIDATPAGGVSVAPDSPVHLRTGSGRRPPRRHARRRRDDASRRAKARSEGCARRPRVRGRARRRGEP